MLSTPVARLRPPPVARPAAPDRRWGWALAGGWVAQLLLRLWLFRYHTGPVANPDETGYLVAARWLAGGPGADLTGSTFYQGGYALLLAPIHWVTADPATVYRLVVAVGSMVAATAFPLAYLVLRRLAVGRGAGLGLAFVAGAAPSLLLFSGLALADAILPTLLLGWLLALHDLAGAGPEQGGTGRDGTGRDGTGRDGTGREGTGRDGTGRCGTGCRLRCRLRCRIMRRGRGRDAGVRAGLAAGGLAGFAATVHMRGMVVLAVSVVVVGGLLVSRRVPRRAGLASLAVAAAVATAGTVLNSALAAAIYPGGVRDLSGILVSRLAGLDGQVRALSGAAGQLWYLGVGTWGLAGIGLAAAAIAAVRGAGRAVSSAHRVTAVALLAVTLGIAYASSAALPDEHRVGNYAYGRYLACVAVAWTLVGLAVLARARRPAIAGLAAAAAVLGGVTGGLAAWHGGDRLSRYAFIAFDFPEVIFLSGVRDRLDMAAASLTALALLAALAALATLPWPSAKGWAPAAGLAAVTVAFVVHLAPASAPATGRDWLPAPGPGRVAVDTRVKWNVWLPLAHRVWWTRLEKYDGARQAPPAGACTAIVPPAAGPPPAGWTATGEGGPSKGWTSWRGTGCR
ncbi:hypothetical protein [Nonomuraea indica]|uniref:Glycosyltransferase RgtA/B/C/D-like domain-containing protein n=1 Tax=Nonomuraea indica TaxID=1581193 RepID=A0ABW8A6N1_9ACTN